MWKKSTPVAGVEDEPEKEPAAPWGRDAREMAAGVGDARGREEKAT
jgi:hypothetical protein